MQTLDLQEIMKKNPHLKKEEVEEVTRLLKEAEAILTKTSRYRLATQQRKVVVGSGCEDARVIRLRSQR